MTREGKHLREKKKKTHKGKWRLQLSAAWITLKLEANKRWSVFKTSAKVVALYVASPNEVPTLDFLSS